MRKVSVIGAHEIKWGVLKEKSMLDMIAEAANGAIKDAGIEREAIQCIFLGNAGRNTDRASHSLSRCRQRSGHTLCALNPLRVRLQFGSNRLA